MKRSHSKILLFVFFGFLFPLFSFGQVEKVTLSGVVKEADGAPVSFGNVVLHKMKDTSFVTGTMTDDDGRFEIEDVKPNEYLLEITYVDRKSTRLNSSHVAISYAVFCLK